MIGRFNLFWLGAGGFLVLFCLNEIVAYHLAAVPMWLGGPLSYAGMVVGALVGVSVMAFLGVEEPVEGAPAGATDAGDEPGDDGEEQDEADEAAPASKPEAAHDGGAAAS